MADDVTVDEEITEDIFHDAAAEPNDVLLFSIRDSRNFLHTFFVKKPTTSSVNPIWHTHDGFQD
jgi:hypothetical protein